MQRAASVAWAFSLATSEEIDDAIDQVTTDVTDGIANTTVDGMAVTQMDPMRRLDVVERIERRNAAQSGNLVAKIMRNTVRIVPPGGSGQ
jgi:hypothetical protein